MATNLLFLRLVSAIVVVSAAPTPGRVPRVYNALITSNQNLEPSKSYPVYQPVLHDPFGVSLHPSVFYGGEFAFRNDLNPAVEPSPPQGSTEKAPEAAPSAEPANDAPPAEPTPAPEAEKANPTPATAPSPPDTKPAIPQNDYWLPPQLLPLGPISPAYSGFPQLGPYPLYPGVRLYDPFASGPYGFPFYRTFPNVVGPNYGQGAPLVPVSAPAPPAPASPQNPPAEPSDLNVLNYWSKDPAIPNVPPPPLPQGGLKPDKSE